MKQHSAARVPLYITATSLLAMLAFTSLPLLNRVTAAPVAPAGAVSQTTHPPARNVILSYLYETSANGASGNNNLKVDSIYFYPNYVVVQAENGTTSLFAVDRLKHFDYHPAPR